MAEEYRDFELPKLYKYSGLFVIIGLVMLHWSQAMYFVGGQSARMGSLVIGFGLIVWAAFLRAGGQIGKHLPFFVLTGSYFILLAMLTRFQDHAIWYDRQQQIFTVVCIFLFWSGYILAREKRHDFVSANQLSLVGVGFLALLCLMRFLQFVKLISFEGSVRGYGDTTLNAVGVAFANTCLALVFLTLAILNKNLLRKALYLLVAFAAVFVVLSSASRGAIIWGSLAMVFFFVLNRHRRYLTGRGLLVALLSMLLILPALVVLYQSNYAIAERMDILIDRYSQLFDLFRKYGGGDSDRSIGARQYAWTSYLSTFDQWIIFGEKRQYGYPHNQWLEIFIKFGLLGIPMFLMSIVLFFKISWSAVREKLHPDVEFSIIATLFMFGYLSSLSSLSLQVNRVLWLGFGYLLGYYLERSNRQNALGPPH
jgi:O-antigen ligase